MLDKNELFSQMSILELRDYIDRVRQGIKDDKKEIKDMRIKKGLYKKYREELIPLYEYGMCKYPSQNFYKYQLIEGNQNFDGQITNNSDLVERIELTFPQDGEQNYKEAVELNSRGITGVRLSDDGTQNNLIDRIIKTANVKAEKDYSGSTLIIYVDDFFEIDVSDEDDIHNVEIAVEKMKKINYSASSVYLLLRRQTISGKEYPARMYLIK